MVVCVRATEKAVNHQLSRQEKYSFPQSLLSPPWLLAPLNHRVYPSLSHGLINFKGDWVGEKKAEKCPGIRVCGAGTIHF